MNHCARSSAGPGRSPGDAPHARSAAVSGLLGVLALGGGALPGVRSLAGEWVALFAASLRLAPAPAVSDPRLSAIYLLPYLAVLGLAVMAILVGAWTHLCHPLRPLSPYDVAAEHSRTGLATWGILAGLIALWLLVRQS